MKLIHAPQDLPIEAVHHVTHLLELLITSIRDQRIFASANDRNDYLETLQHLNDDLKKYFATYEDWQFDFHSSEFQAALSEMHEYLREARSLLDQASGCTLH